MHFFVIWKQSSEWSIDVHCNYSPASVYDAPLPRDHIWPIGALEATARMELDLWVRRLRKGQGQAVDTWYELYEALR